MQKYESHFMEGYSYFFSNLRGKNNSLSLFVSEKFVEESVRPIFMNEFDNNTGYA